MSYTITASYSSWIEFDLDELLEDNEEYDLEDIESYEVMRGTLYLTMKDSNVLEFESMIDTDFKYPNNVTLRDLNGDEIEVEDLPTLQEQIEMNKKELAKLEAEFATMKERITEMSDINAEINALVDRIWIDDGAFNPPTTLIEDVRKSDQYQVKDLLIEIENTLNNHNAEDSLNVYAEQLSHLAHRVSMDHIDVPLTEEEQTYADYESMMLIQAKRDCREWEASREKQT